MNFSEQPPSTQWATLKYRGEKFAEVWFKPEGEPFGLTFRIPRESFQRPGMAPLLTAENLLKAVGIAAEAVEAWRPEGAAPPDADGPAPELGHPLPPPADDAGHLSLHVSLKPPHPDVPPEGGSERGDSEPGSSPVKWEDLASRWRTIMGVEATIDNLRLTLEGLQVQMENEAKTTLMTEEKLHALNADVAAWTKAKSRVHHTLPKVREYVHRATWVTGTPERKKLQDLFKEDETPDLPVAELIKLSEQLENLLKDRQILSAQGVSVCQECKNVSSDIHRSLQNLKSNAAANADRKRRAGRPKGKFFKHVRKWSGAD